MIRVHLNLTETANPAMGIGQYARNIAEGLWRLGRYEIDAVAHRVDVCGLPFKVRRGFFPRRYFFDRQKWHRWCPLSYNAMVGDFRSDVSLFFPNMMPLMRVRGKAIGVIHDLIPFRIPNVLIDECKWFTRASLAAYCEKHEHLAHNADRVITVSEYSRREIAKEFGLDESSIAVVPNGVDAERYAQLHPGDTPEGIVRAKYGLPDRFILYFGTTATYKNVGNLIRGYAQLPAICRNNVSLVVTHGNEALAKIAEEEGVASQMRFLGFIPEEDKPSIYRLANAFAFLSRIEGFGIPPLEAMAAGVPTLVSNCTTLPEVVGDGAETVDPDDILEIGVKLERMLDDVCFRDMLVEKGRKRATQFSWDGAALKMAEVIDGLCVK